METRRDQLGRFPLTPRNGFEAPAHRANPRPGKPEHPLARNIQLALAGGAVLLVMLSGSLGGGIGLLILAGFYALGYCFPTRWMIAGVPLLGVVAYVLVYAMAEAERHKPEYDGWSDLIYALLFVLVVIVLAAVWLGAVVGALVTRGDRKRREPARGVPDEMSGGW